MKDFVKIVHRHGLTIFVLFSQTILRRNSKYVLKKNNNGRTCLLLNMLNCCLQKMSDIWTLAPGNIIYLFTGYENNRIAIIKKSQ